MSDKKKSLKKIVWTKSELNNFAIGLQKYGFSQKEKIAELVSTRDKQEVIEYLTSAEQTLQKKFLQRKKAKAKESPYQEVKHVCMFSRLAVEVLEGPPVRKWNYMARVQQCDTARRQDYSKHSLGDILDEFYEEAETPRNAQVIDVKSIYKFLSDCTKGKNPTELMPKESGLVLMLLKKMKEFQDSMDLDEERQYFRDYKGAVRFAPLKVKDEGKEKNTEDGKNEDSQEKSEDEEMEEDVYKPEDLNAVKIPEEIFDSLETHYKLVDSFNPLLVPLWFLNKHQAALEPLMKNILGRKDT